MSAPHKRFARNTTGGRDLIVGDIHGYFNKLKSDLDAIGFSPLNGDRLFSVGDLVDRGPDSAQVSTWLDAPWFHPVQGNHEFAVGAYQRGEVPLNVYASFGSAWLFGLDFELRNKLAAQFDALPYAITLETAAGLVGIVHAECPTPTWNGLLEALEALPNGNRTAALQSSILDRLQWGRQRLDDREVDHVEGVVAVVVGHSPVKAPTTYGNHLFIDIKAWWQRHQPGPFCVIDAATLQPVTPIVPPVGWRE